MKTKMNITGTIMIMLLLLFMADVSGAIKIKMGSKGQIRGTISCATSGQPIKNVSVTVYSAADSSMVAGTITNNDGSFFLCMLASGSYLLEISIPGFIKRFIPGLIVRSENPGVDLGDIQLIPVESVAKRRKKKQQMVEASLKLNKCQVKHLHLRTTTLDSDNIP